MFLKGSGFKIVYTAMLAIIAFILVVGGVALSRFADVRLRGVAPVGSEICLNQKKF
jgi:hypothetical protein